MLVKQARVSGRGRSSSKDTLRGTKWTVTQPSKGPGGGGGCGGVEVTVAQNVLMLASGGEARTEKYPE